VLRVARRVAELRRAKGLTQDQLAEALGTATRNVQRIEAGQNLTLFTIARIAAVLGVEPEGLVAGAMDRSYGTTGAARVSAVAERAVTRAKTTTRTKG
jgi:transcriptional regulator with XRE-family HTH domain